jgi:hypothetical protein
MSVEPGLLGLYWPARQQSLEECSARVLDSLCALQSHGYQRFFRLGRSRRDGLKREFLVNADTVTALLAKGVNQTDIPRRPIPELGWSLSLWSGDSDDESYALRLHCGSYSHVVGNSFVMQLPCSGPHSLPISSDRALAAYTALVDIWQPEQAILCTGLISWEDGVLAPEGESIALLQRTR